MWGYLRYLRSPSNVERVLTGGVQSERTFIHPVSVDTSKRAYEISACIRQADEYYRASEAVGLTTQPLLQFYGAESLAKALILANFPGIWLTDLKYHGLATRPIPKAMTGYSSDPEIWKVEDEFAVVAQDGVFSKLCQTVEGQVPRKDTVLTFRQIIRVIPDLSNLYGRHFGETSHCFYLYSVPEIDENEMLHVFFDRHYDYAQLLSVFPEFDSGFVRNQSDGSSVGFISTTTHNSMPSFFRQIDGTVGGRYLVRPLDGGLASSPCTLFAALFIIGNVVRYKPSLWMREIDGVKPGSASVVEALCNLAKRRLPNDVLEGIWGEKYSYGIPARLS